MIAISRYVRDILANEDGVIESNPSDWWKISKPACIWAILCMVVQIPVVWLKCIVMIICFIPHAIYEKLAELDF